MDYVIPSTVFAAAMLIGMLICLEAGRSVGTKWIGKYGSKPTFSGVEGPLFALFGLLIAFTFAGAPARLDVRRKLVSDEAVAIRSAYMRIDLLSPDSQEPMRQRFRDYLDTRLAVYNKLPDIDAAMAELRTSERMQNEIWTEAIAAVKLPGAHPNAGVLLLNAITSMIDVTTTRLTAARTHPPFVIYILLFVLALVISALAGFGTADHVRRSWMHLIPYAIVPAVVVFIILEIEYPRMSILPLIGSLDQVLVDLRATMH